MKFMSSQQVWPQLAAPPVSELQSQLQSQPLLQAARGGYPDGSFGPLALGPLAAPLQLRMMNCGGGDCTLHTGTNGSTSATQKDDWKHRDIDETDWGTNGSTSATQKDDWKNRDKDETDCCSWGTVKYAFCDCNPFLCCYNITHFIF